MKVDKSVCTTNDKTLEDLNCVIKFDAVFTTLVENKILSIKRDCEQKELNKKRTRSIGRLLFGRTVFCDKKVLEKRLEDVEIGELQHHAALPRMDNGGSGSAGVGIGGSMMNTTTPVAPNSSIVVDETCLTTATAPTDKTEDEVDDDTVNIEFEEVSVSIEIESSHPAVGEDEPYISDLDNSVSVTVDSERKKSTASEPIKFCGLSSQQDDAAGEGGTSKYLSAKSISAQSTPILPRPKGFTESRGKTVAIKTPMEGIALASSSTNKDKTVDKCIKKSSPKITPQNSVLVDEISSAPVTVTTNTPTNASTTITGVAAAITNKKSSKRDRERVKDYPRLEYEINYQANPLSQGFISSFNQLTTNLPVLATSVGTAATTTVTATCKTRSTLCDSKKLQRSASTAYETSAPPKGRVSDQSGSDEEYKKRKRKTRKYS